MAIEYEAVFFGRVFLSPMWISPSHVRVMIPPVSAINPRERCRKYKPLWRLFLNGRCVRRSQDGSSSPRPALSTRTPDSTGEWLDGRSDNRTARRTVGQTNGPANGRVGKRPGTGDRELPTRGATDMFGTSTSSATPDGKAYREVRDEVASDEGGYVGEVRDEVTDDREVRDDATGGRVRRGGERP